MRPTANDRLKQRARKVKWVAGLVAVALHVLLFLLWPPFAVEGARLRMELAVGPWEPPSLPDRLPPGHVAFDSTMTAPELANHTWLSRRLPRSYPWLLWHHREPSSALIQMTVGPSGRVERVRLLDSSDNGADRALLDLARRMVLDPRGLPPGGTGLVADVRVSVVEP